MELCLHRVRGRAVPLSVTLRQCTREEAETVYRLQNEVRAMMPNPELFMPDTLENIQSYLEHDLCLGAWDGERLGAYFILRYCGHSEHNYAAFMGIPEAEWEHWGQCRQRHRPPGLAGQWPAAHPSGRRAAAASARHRGHWGHRQPRQPLQHEQRQSQRL